MIQDYDGGSIKENASDSTYWCVYKGIVVDNRFPFPGKKPGMVKVRIPAIHGKAGEGGLGTCMSSSRSGL